MTAPERDDYPPDHDHPPAIVTKKAVWGCNLGAPIPAPPEEVFAAWLDGKTFAAITGKPAKGSANIGAERAMYGGFAKGAVVEIEAPRRVVETWRSKHFPKDAKDSVIQVFFERKGDGTAVHLRQWAFAKVPGRPLDYETMMFWTQKILQPFMTHFSTHREAPATKAEPLAAARRKDLKARLAKDGGAIDAWVRDLAPFGEAVLLHACIGAARAALPVWTSAEKAKPRSKDFRDVVAGFKTEGGAPPSKIIAALSAYLDDPSSKKRAVAVATLDPTAQLRFTDEDMGDLSEMPWAYALESARCGAYALDRNGDATKEAPLAAESAQKALGGGRKADAAVRLAIRKELEAWLTHNS